MKKLCHEIFHTERAQILIFQNLSLQSNIPILKVLPFCHICFKKNTEKKIMAALRALVTYSLPSRGNLFLQFLCPFVHVFILIYIFFVFSTNNTQDFKCFIIYANYVIVAWPATFFFYPMFILKWSV